MPFHVGAYFCMGAYKRDVVVIKMGTYIHRVLILCGCSLSQFYGILIVTGTTIVKTIRLSIGVLVRCF